MSTTTSQTLLKNSTKNANLAGTPVSRSTCSETVSAFNKSEDNIDSGTSSYGTLHDLYGDEFNLPDFTIKQIREAIPSSCFERSYFWSYSYVVRDLILLASTFYIFNTLVTPINIPSFATRVVLWTAYTFLQGLFATGIWVLAHECGHQAFSPSKTINDITGFILHSALLVPYFSWKISHGKHHKSTGHMERDMVHMPRTRSEIARRAKVRIEQLSELTEDAPINTLLYVIGRQIFGWPIYLFSNDTGHDHHEKQSEGRGKGKKNGFFAGVNHFNPSSPIYDNRDASLILLSDLGLLLAGSALYYLCQTYGWVNMAVWYGVPYLWVNNWLVGITYLQHTDPSLPHYSSSTWSFPRGASCTIDRHVPFVDNYLWHGILSTHVLHHFVSTIPFYNADRATNAIIPVMGKHYKRDTQWSEWGLLGFYYAIYKNTRWCQWVEPSKEAKGNGKDVVFFRNRRGLGAVRPLDMKSDTD